MLLAQIQGVKDSSRIALPQWADLLTQPTATLLPPELCLAVRTISFLLAPLDLHGPEARVLLFWTSPAKDVQQVLPIPDQHTRRRPLTCLGPLNTQPTRTSHSQYRLSAV